MRYHPWSRLVLAATGSPRSAARTGGSDSISGPCAVDLVTWSEHPRARELPEHFQGTGRRKVESLERGARVDPLTDSVPVRVLALAPRPHAAISKFAANELLAGYRFHSGMRLRIPT